MIWTVQRLGRKGDGVAVSGDQRALVPLVLPQEVIEGDAVDGRIADPKIVTPSPHRVRAACPHYRACGGCSLMHADDGFVRDWKVGVVQTALAAQGVPARVDGVHVSPPGSRRRAVFSARRTKKGALAGFHARASDVIVDVQDCRVLRPDIVAALPLIRQMTVAGGSRSGELSVTVTASTDGLDVAVTGGKPMDPALLAALADLAAQGDWARLTWDGQSLTRRPPVQRFGRARVVPPPGAFLQATTQAESAMLAVLRQIDARRVLELFAGCGTLTLPLAERATVHAVEGLTDPLAALDSGWRGAGLHRVTTQVRDLAARPVLAAEMTGFDAIVIDPPRAGAEPQAHEIARSDIPVIGWISCDPVSFARDAAILVAGGYRLAQLFVLDQFRWSPHVETAAIFRKT